MENENFRFFPRFFMFFFMFRILILVGFWNFGNVKHVGRSKHQSEPKISIQFFFCVNVSINYMVENCQILHIFLQKKRSDLILSHTFWKFQIWKVKIWLCEPEPSQNFFLKEDINNLTIFDHRVLSHIYT